MALSRGQTVRFVGGTGFGCLVLVLLNLADYSRTKADRADEDERLNTHGEVKAEHTESRLFPKEKLLTLKLN